MKRISKIAISLPEPFLDEVDKECAAKGHSRSEFFRRAAAALLRRERERVAVEEYVQAYSLYPESQEDLGWLEDASQEVLRTYPWQNERGD